MLLERTDTGLFDLHSNDCKRIGKFPERTKSSLVFTFNFDESGKEIVRRESLNAS